MATLQTLFAELEGGELINELKSGRLFPTPDTTTARMALDPQRHLIMNTDYRKDKRVKVDDDSEGESAQRKISSTGDTSNYRTEKVARVALALQRLIVNRAVSFCFGNPISYHSTPTNDKQKAIAKALDKILYDVKSTSLNRRIGRAIFSFRECAEYWYSVESPNSRYGFNSQFKMRCQIFTPEFGDTLYPYFNAEGDMIAFSRAFTRKDANEVAVNYFETFTDEEHWLWKSTEKGFTVAEGYPKPVTIGKIPIIYGHQPHHETYDVDKLIDRLELLLSNFADTNDYHASPKIFVTGRILGWAKKGDSGAVIEGEDGATMQYVSWASAPESVKLEIETLLKMIYTISQTPDISFDNVKGVGALSGVALKLLFMDAHLKVQDKREIFDDYLQRRVSVLLAYIGKLNTTLEAECELMEIDPEIVPYMLTSEKDELEYWITANGNKAVISQEESVKAAGLSSDPDLTMQKIVEESDRSSLFRMGEPVDA